MYQDGSEHQYNFTYDYLKRLLGGLHISPTSGNNQYNSTYQYRDGRGNFLQTTRRSGNTTIDNMTYFYHTGTNKIKNISDMGTTQGYKQETTNDYIHNNNGAMTYDAETGATIERDHHNLISSVADQDSNYVIYYLRDASGALRQQIIDSLGYARSITRIGAMEYRNGGASLIHHDHGYAALNWGMEEEEFLTGSKTHVMTEEGLNIYNNRSLLPPADETNRAGHSINLVYPFNVQMGAAYLAEIQTPSLQGIDYVYNIKDHLGSPRILFSDDNGNGIITATEVHEHINYYPFGLRWVEPTSFKKYRKSYTNKDATPYTQYLEFEARGYVKSINLFDAVDPAADLMPSWSPYSYTFNNPINYTDPTGAIPYPITFRSFHPGKTFGGGFGGDGRGFSHRSNVTSRVSHTVVADAAAGSLSYDPRQTFSSESHHPIFGRETEIPTGYANKTSSDGNTLSFETGYSGDNPLVPSPLIDVAAGLSITEDLDAGFLAISGSVNGDDFPNTEVFITDPSGQSVFIGGDVRGRNNPGALVGGADERIMDVGFQIKIDGKGNFQNVIYKGQEYNIVDYNNMFIDKNPNPNNDRP